MQARVDWVLIISGTQVIKKKRPVRPVFPDYLSVSYDYDVINGEFLAHKHSLKKDYNRKSDLLKPSKVMSINQILHSDISYVVSINKARGISRYQKVL